MNALPQEDLSDIAAATASIWEASRGVHILITGGTGFFGIWLLESLCHVNRVYGYNISATVLSRDPQAFLAKFPRFSTCTELRFIKGDVKDFDVSSQAFDYVIHGATEASARMINEAPQEMYSTICDGTRHVLELVRQRGCRRLLYLSSGAVYGEQPPTIPHVSETYVGGPDAMNPGAVYAEAKRMGENLCAIHSHTHGLDFTSARCFAFVGPHLPLNSHFAIGNFIRDVLEGSDIQISGDGTPLRSYLYSSDLCSWLWHLLFRGKSREAYNVGSEEAVSIRELAEAVVRVSGTTGNVRLAQQPRPGILPRRYVPSTDKIRRELGLEQRISLDKAILKTLSWHRYTNT